LEHIKHSLVLAMGTAGENWFCLQVKQGSVRIQGTAWVRDGPFFVRSSTPRRDASFARWLSPRLPCCWSLVMSAIALNVASSPSIAGAAVEQRLRACPYWAVRQLVCHVDRSRVIVRGTVPSYYLKQVAEALVARATGPECIECDIDVQVE
jgi:hypothetical protein